MITYVSLDVETDGPCPGVNSMLQLGAAVFDENGSFIESLSYNLDVLPEAVADPSTLKWWKERQAVYAATRVNTLSPARAMAGFVGWLKQFPKPTALCYPAGFDFTWVYWYLHKFTGSSPFGFQALDIKSYAAAVLGVPYRNAIKNNMPKEWFAGLPKHKHDACADAIEQGMLFFKMRKM